MSDVKLTLDNVTIEGVNIKYVNKASSILDSNYNNAAKKELKDVTKTLKLLDTVIEKLGAAPSTRLKFAFNDYNQELQSCKKLSDLIGFDFYDYTVRDLVSSAARKYKKKPLTKDEIILACNKEIEALEPEVIKYQTQLEKKFSDDRWLLHLTFSKYCYIDIKGAAAKKVYEILSDKEDHTFVFRLSSSDVKDADYFYHLTLTAIDAEEV